MATRNQQNSELKNRSVAYLAISFITVSIAFSLWNFRHHYTELLSSNETTANSSNNETAWRVTLTNTTDFVDEQSLEEFIKTNDQSSFFSLAIDDVNNLLLTHPWVKSVEVRKVWPNTLELNVQERQPWLRLNEGKIISKEGVVFEPFSIEGFDDLPHLVGKFGSVDDLLSMYSFFNNKMPIDGYQINRLVYTDTKGWVMTLENKIQLIVGKNNLAERLERFSAVVEEIKRSEKKARYIDMRYQSGLAVGWHTSEQNNLSKNS
jgi:cell division protein FtsQ